jgi:hypothetical protein
VAGGDGIAAQRSETVPFRTDVIRIPLAEEGFGLSQLEYKVRMQKGSTLTYSWSVPELAGDTGTQFWTELHGHTVADGKAMTVVDYRKEFGASDAGAITAALDGVHGWYMRNRAPGPVTMELRLAGFYTLIPPGETGNEARITPVAAQGATAK